MMALHCYFLLIYIILTEVEISCGSQFKPVITGCSVNSTKYKHIVTLNWTLLNRRFLSKIREYMIYCNCSNNYTKSKISGLCTSKPCFHHSFSLLLDTCIDKCSCRIYGNPRWAHSFNSSYWSDSCNFTIGPLAPRMAPDVFEPVTKENRKRLIHIAFELSKPLQELYCDTDNVRGVSVNVTQDSGDSYYFNIDGIDIRKINDTYEFTLQFNNLSNYDFWSSSYLSISVHNSKDGSPFSSPCTIRGAVNGDIEFGSYELRDANISNTSASFFWLLKKPLPNMLEWGFIKGSQYNLTLFDGALIKNNTINDVSFTLNDLSPGQKYLICVTLITTDTDSWPPWPSCKNFMTKEGFPDASIDDIGGDNNTNVKSEANLNCSTQQSYSSGCMKLNAKGRSKLFSATLSNYTEASRMDILWFPFIVTFGLFIVVVIISVLCLKPYCSKKRNTTRTTERNSVSEEIMQMSSHVTTIPIFGPGDSDIESLTEVSTSTENRPSSLQGEYVQIKDVSSDTQSINS